MEALLTGIMNFKTVDRAADAAGMHGEESSFGHLVAPNVEAPHHQHFFNFRLDLDVDGPSGNRVVEMDTEGLPAGTANRYGNGFAMKETVLRREQEAQRTLNLATSRRWKLLNPAVTNALGQPSGYMLIPGENSLPFVAPDSFLRRKAGFVNAHLWVTPYAPQEQHAAGDYVNQGPLGDGLPKWTAANRSIVDQDLVVWYTLGVTHIPRVEEWPVMPVHRAGFKLVPAGFFSRNPALDVPKPRQ
jgi:primary-amine oxidase